MMVVKKALKKIIKSKINKLKHTAVTNWYKIVKCQSKLDILTTKLNYKLIRKYYFLLRLETVKNQVQKSQT